ncbi:MAG: hypothetical protein M1840_003268 [Geoglossum simile]|nr:MAG: hypothetical protein M1840_003268 [Geoglossum simile]
MISDVTDASDSRISRGKFVETDSEGSVVAEPEAYFSNMSPDMYKVGAGPQKLGMTWGPRGCTSISWSEPRTTRGCLFHHSRQGDEGHPRESCVRQEQEVKFVFGPIFNMLEGAFPEILNDVGDYWLNAF